MPMPPLQFSTSPETVLITGATGFIGRQLVRALLAEGKQLTVLTRNPQQAATLFNGKVHCISDMSELPSEQKVDVIVNLAGARILGWRWSAARKATLLRSRVQLTNSLTDWIERARHKPGLLLSASAIGYYGVQPQQDDTELTEESPAQPIFMSQLCQQWEDSARRAGRSGVRIVIMRLGFVLGQQGSLPMMLLPVKFGLGGRLGSGRQWLSWIHVQDVLRAMAFLWNRNEFSGAVNFSAPQAVRQQQFMQTAASVLHRPCFMPTPGFPVRVLLGEQADLLLEGQRVAPARLQSEGFEFAFPELKMALENLLQARPD